MFTQRKGRAEICNEPEFLARFVGKAETFVATKKGCTHSVVQRIWDNSEEEHLLRRISVFICPAGITITDLEDKHTEEKIDIKDISYCCAEKPPHERVFTWICKNKSAKKLECYAVVCPTREKAQVMAMLLNKSFQIAYVDWKAKKEKRARMKQQAAANKKQESATKDHRNGNKSSSEDGDQASTSSTGSSSEMSPSMLNGMAVNGMMVNGHSEGLTGNEEEDQYVYTETMMAQMNIVEEDEISFSDTNITIDPKDKEKPKRGFKATWT